MDPLLHQHLEALTTDPNVLGVLLFGSWARGTNRPDSDVDLLVIVQHGFQRVVEYRADQVFEVTYTTEAAARTYWRANPDEAVELWSIARVLFDRDGTIERLRTVGTDILAAGKPPLAPERLAHAQFDCRDQLRAVEHRASRDPLTARMLLSALVCTMLELYFDIRQQWTPPPKQRLAVLQHVDPELYRHLSTYYDDAPLGTQIRAAQSIYAIVFSEEGNR